MRNAGLLFDRVAELTAQIDALDKQVRSIVREDDEMRRLMTIPGVGEISAMAVRAFAPAMESFGRGRDFAAWIGLTPREASTAGRQRLGRITRMGQRDLRQLLILGATAVVRHARRRKEIEDPWLRRMCEPVAMIRPANEGANGGAKVDHGSGGTVPLRRSQTLPLWEPFPVTGRVGRFIPWSCIARSVWRAGTG